MQASPSIFSCPFSGAPGGVDAAGNAVGSPASDYGLSFLSSDQIALPKPFNAGDTFSIAFWYKAFQRPFGYFTIADDRQFLYFFGGNSVNAAGNNLTLRVGGTLALYVDGGAITDNHPVSPSIWRGIIDTRAPRLVMEAEYTDTDYDSTADLTRYEFNYTCSAEDRYLVEETFAFDGIPGGREVAAFTCQLDEGAFTPCTNPWSYHDLSKGDHTFRVRSIDEAGYVDLSPASFAWSVNALDTTISASPESSTGSREATFTFTGSGSDMATYFNVNEGDTHDGTVEFVSSAAPEDGPSAGEEQDEEPVDSEPQTNHVFLPHVDGQRKGVAASSRRLISSYRSSPGRRCRAASPMVDVGDAALAIAKLEGFLARRHDRQPGVPAIWRGWQHLQDMHFSGLKKPQGLSVPDGIQVVWSSDA